MCYNIETNETLFDKDILEGVYCMTCGKYSNYEKPLCIVGGNCAVVGVDSENNDEFWTVLGGNAICMILCDINGDNLNELIVGTDDYTIRVYQQEAMLYEINENTKIISVESIGGNEIVYALENGTIGLYSKQERKWKQKEKGYVSSIIIDDFNEDNKNEILCGWSTGRIDLRNWKEGTIILEIDISQKIAKVLYDKFNSTNNNKILVVVTEKGQIFGYQYGYESLPESETKFVTKDKNIDPQDLTKYEYLLNKKKKLLENLETLTIMESNKTKINSPKDNIVLPKNTQVKIDLQSNNQEKCADLIIESSPEGVVIHTVVLVSEQLYKGETFVKLPSNETNKVIIQIKTAKDFNINLHIKVLIGKSYYLGEYQVLEFNKIIPKYCFYILLRDEVCYKDELVQGISFKFNERIDRLILWLEVFFNIAKKELENFRPNEFTYKIRFMSLRTDKILQISVEKNILSIFTEEIELAGNILQDMCKYFKIENMDTTINYREVIKKFSIVIERISVLDRERNQFNINMTEIITTIKDLYVRAEDHRLLEDFKGLKRYFEKINIQNLGLLDEFEKRTKAYQQLISDLKQINDVIQMFSNLKAGTYKNDMVKKCRNCIRTKNYNLLIKILSTGIE